MNRNIENYNNLLDIWDHREYLQPEYELMHHYLVLNNYDTYNAAAQYRLEVPIRNRNSPPDYRVFQRLNNRMRTSGCLKPNHQYGGRHQRVSFTFNKIPG